MHCWVGVSVDLYRWHGAPRLRVACAMDVALVVRRCASVANRRRRASGGAGGGAGGASCPWCGGLFACVIACCTILLL